MRGERRVVNDRDARIGRWGRGCEGRVVEGRV